MFELISLTAEDWLLFENKYKRLMHTISRQVSGDCITCDPEDNYSDLCVTAIGAINTYSKKMQIPFKSIIETVEFSKYIKSCLWNCKNKKGSTITKKIILYKNKANIEEIYNLNYDEHQ